MSSAKSASKSSSSSHSGDSRSRRKTHHRSSHESKHRHHRHQTNQKVSDLDHHSKDSQVHSKRESNHSEGSVTQDGDQGEELYRLDDGSEIWRSFDGSVIFWEVHKLTFEKFSQAIWDWAERGLDQIQKSYVASIHPPHGGHQSRLLDFFCSHRQKLIRDHIQRIYSDLYLILRTWTELKHYLRQLNEKSIAQQNSKTVKKIENRLTFHLMVSLREYGGLPLDPKHPDKPSWPSSGENQQNQKKKLSRLKAEALAATSHSISKSSGSEKSISLNQDTDIKAICSHCHQVLKSIPVEKNANVEVDTNSFRAPPSVLPEVQPDSHSDTVKCHRSASHSHKDSKDNTASHSHKDNKISRDKSKNCREEEKKTTSPSSKCTKELARSGSFRSPHKTSGKSNRKSKSQHHSSDESDNMSLISFDSIQFSNTFGTMFNLL